VTRTPTIRVDPTTVNRLYGGTADTCGSVASLDHLPKNMVMRWVGEGSLTWQVDAPESGDYEVALCYAALTEGAAVEVISGDSKAAGELHMTNGIYQDQSASERSPSDTGYLRNYERAHLKGSLSLSAGTNEIMLRVTEAKAATVIDLRSLELTPLAAKQELAAAAERAKKQRASTDWLVEAGYGVMFHWTDESQPRHGPKKPYADAVRDFDVDAFADMVEETGAGYVLLTLNHGNPHCPAPIAAWEALHPGWTTERDLVAEMAAALGERRIRLMLYIASHILMDRRFDEKPEDSIGEFGDVEQAYADVLAEIGRRYGEKLAGYWFDGWDHIPTRYPDVRWPYEHLFEASKAGNPDRIISLNYWFFPDETPWQEYWAGEIDGPLKPLSGRFIEHAAGEGLQLQALIMLEDIWEHGEPDSAIPQPTFSAGELIQYVKGVMEKQGVMTINLGIYQDGGIGDESRRRMRALRRAIRG